MADPGPDPQRANIADTLIHEASELKGILERLDHLGIEGTAPEEAPLPPAMAPTFGEPAGDVPPLEPAESSIADLATAEAPLAQEPTADALDDVEKTQASAPPPEVAQATSAAAIEAPAPIEPAPLAAASAPAPAPTAAPTAAQPPEPSRGSSLGLVVAALGGGVFVGGGVVGVIALGVIGVGLLGAVGAGAFFVLSAPGDDLDPSTIGDVVAVEPAVGGIEADTEGAEAPGAGSPGAEAPAGEAPAGASAPAPASRPAPSSSEPAEARAPAPSRPAPSRPAPSSSKPAPSSSRPAPSSTPAPRSGAAPATDELGFLEPDAPTPSPPGSGSGVVEPDPEEMLTDEVVVKVLTNPPAAQVWLDGVAMGRTPAKLSISAGTYQLTIASGKARETFLIEAQSDTYRCYEAAGKRLYAVDCP